MQTMADNGGWDVLLFQETTGVGRKWTRDRETLDGHRLVAGEESHNPWDCTIVIHKSIRDHVREAWSCKYGVGTRLEFEGENVLAAAGHMPPENSQDTGGGGTLPRSK